MRLFLIFVVGLSLVACAPRGRIEVIPKESANVVQPVFFATNRRENGVDFGPERAGVLRFGRMDVSVPYRHEVGQVELPGARVNPKTDFAITGAIPHRTAREFRMALNGALTKLKPGARNVVVYVHGYNATFAEGLFRLAQISHDFDSHSVPVFFSWPSGGEVRDYLYDRDSVLQSRRALGDLIDNLSATKAERITIVSHSMGAQLAMETLRSRVLKRGKSWAKLSGFILIQPDIDIDLFRAQAADIGPLPQPFVIFTSRKDRILGLSRRIAASEQRLGELDDLAVLQDLRVTVIDTTDASSAIGANHFEIASSPRLIRLLTGLGQGVAEGALSPRRTSLLPLRLVTEKRAVGLIVGFD